MKHGSKAGAVIIVLILAVLNLNFLVELMDEVYFTWNYSGGNTRSYAVVEYESMENLGSSYGDREASTGSSFYALTFRVRNEGSAPMYSADPGIFLRGGGLVNVYEEEPYNDYTPYSEPYLPGGQETFVRRVAEIADGRRRIYADFSPNYAEKTYTQEIWKKE